MFEKDVSAFIQYVVTVRVGKMSECVRQIICSRFGFEWGLYGLDGNVSRFMV